MTLSAGKGFTVDPRSAIIEARGKEGAYRQKGMNDMRQFDPKAFARALRTAREERELSQRELSQRSVAADDPADRISEPYISVLERAQQEGRPSDKMLDAIARGLHIDTWEVRGWAGIERAPAWATTLRAIQDDPALSDDDKVLFESIYRRMVGKSARSKEQ